MTISRESAERIALLYGVAKEHGSLVTVRDLLPLLPGDATEEELADAITSTPSLSSKFELKSGYITERSDGTEVEHVVLKELANRKWAQINLQWAKSFVPLLHSTPFTMVAASGSTSYRSASHSKDLDLFCVAPTGKLWTALTRGLIMARAHRVLHPRSPEICFSCVMDEGFAVPLFRANQGPLFARDALETIVLRGESTYRRLLREATWVSALYPRAYSAKIAPVQGRREVGNGRSIFSRLAEAILFRVVGAYVRTKSRMLNTRFAGGGQLDSMFVVRSGRDHLIYESRRYSRLKQKYASGFGKEAAGSSLGLGLDPQAGVSLGSRELQQEGLRIGEIGGGAQVWHAPDARAEFIRFSTRGRVTGLPHIVQLRFVWRDGSFWVVPGRAKSDWVMNATVNRHGVVRLGELLYDVSAEPADGQETRRVLAEFRSKYGGALVDRWYAETGSPLRLAPTSPPSKRGSAGGEQDTKITLADWRKVGTDYYGAVATAFDSASEEYDFTISHNYINTWIRRRSVKVLLDRVRPDDFLLEVGAGTGAEEMEIAKHVHGLIAIDISQSMVDLLSAKVRARRLTGKVFPIRAAASDLTDVRSLLGGSKVRVAYSFNGALNCEPKVRQFVEGLAGIVERDGLFICSVRNTFCLTEAISHLAVLQFDRMNPRKHQPVMVSVGGKDIPSTYYTPEDFARVFRSHFNVEEMIAIPGLLPPAYLNDYFLRLRNLTSLVEQMDRVFSGRFPLNRFGDQTLFVFRKSR